MGVATFLQGAIVESLSLRTDRLVLRELDEPDWQVVKWDPREFDQLVGKLFADEDEMDMVLVHSVTHEHGGPFRHSEEREPYALVSSARVNEIT